VAHDANVQSTKVVDVVISGRQDGQIVLVGAADVESAMMRRSIAERSALKKLGRRR
jgi:hypothetical protein